MNTANPSAQPVCANCQTCGTCAEWTRHEDPRMPEHGSCVYRSTGFYSHQVKPCLFTPSRWKEKK